MQKQPNFLLIIVDDEIYAEEIIELIQRLEHRATAQPWLMVASFVNPHDIALFGAITKKETASYVSVFY